MQRKRWEQAFLDSYKPATIVSPKSPFLGHLKAEYPYITPFDREEGSCIFFQREEQKENYAREMEGVAWGTFDFHYIVGVTWAGFSFASHIDWVDQDVGWMWRRYHHPQAVGYPLYIWDLNIGTFEFPVGEFERLVEVQEQIKEKRKILSYQDTSL